MTRLTTIILSLLVALLIASCGKGLSVNGGAAGGPGYNFATTHVLQVSQSAASLSNGLLNINYKANASNANVSQIIATFSDNSSQTLSPSQGSECQSAEAGHIFTINQPQGKTITAVNVTVSVGGASASFAVNNPTDSGSNLIGFDSTTTYPQLTSLAQCQSSVNGDKSASIPVQMATSQIGSEVKFSVSMAQNALSTVGTQLLSGYINFGDGSPSVPFQISTDFNQRQVFTKLYAAPLTGDAPLVRVAHVVVISPNGFHSVTVQNITIYPVASTTVPANPTVAPVVHFSEIRPGFFAKVDSDLTLQPLLAAKPNDVILVGPDDSTIGNTGGAHVIVYSLSTTPPTPLMELYPFGTVTMANNVISSNFKKGVTVALGDLDGDGSLDIITGSGDATGVRIYSGRDKHMIYSGVPITGSTGGLYVGAVDLGNTGTSSLVVGDDSNQVVVLSLVNGVMVSQTSGVPKMPAVGAGNFTGGARVAGYNNFIVSGRGNLHTDVAIAQGASGLSNPTKVTGKIGKFVDKGAWVALGAFGAGKNLGFVVGSIENQGPPVVEIVTNYNATPQNIEITPFTTGLKGGVRVGTGDINGDGTSDVIVGAGPDGSIVSSVQVYNGMNGSKLPIADIVPYPGFKGGIYVNGYANPK